MAIGYKFAADILVKEIKEKSIPLTSFNLRDVESLVYPIAFLYRHYLELRLKEIIKEGRDLIGDDPTYKTTHNLIKLWENAKSVIEKVYPNDDPQVLIEAELFLKTFNEVDSMSESFRYPTDKSGNTLLTEWENLSLQELADEIEKVYQLVVG